MEPLTDVMEIWRGLLRGQRAMLNRVMAEMKRDFDLTTAQYEALLTVYECGGSVSVGDLARELVYSSGSTTHLVSRLEERGLVVRVIDGADARRVIVSLTDAGQVLISDATSAHRVALDAQFTPLVHGDEVEVLLRFTRRLAAAEGVTSRPERLS